MPGKLVDAEEVLNAGKNAIANAKAKLINIPAKLAWELSGLDKPEDIQRRLVRVIDEALIELGSESRNFSKSTRLTAGKREKKRREEGKKGKKAKGYIVLRTTHTTRKPKVL